MEPVSIDAGRLHLRPWGPGDVEAVLRGGSDPQVSRWTQVPRPYTRADAEQFVGEYVPRSWAEDGELVWGVFDRATGAALATVGLHAPHPAGVREVGFWCLPEARGQGVVADAVHAVARWAFAELGLGALVWAAEVGNAGSLRVAEKAGFAFEGRRRASLEQRDGSLRDGWWATRLPGDGPDGAPPALPDPGTLSAGDLRLRRWRPDDGDALAAAVGQERNALPPAPAGVDAGQRPHWWTGTRAPEQWAAGDGAPLAVLDSSGAVAGSLQLFLRGRRSGVGELGVWVAPAFRGRGTATAALSALLDWAGPALGLSRVEWHASPANAASLALAARLGFEREGLAVAAFPPEDRALDFTEGRRDAVVLARLLG